MGLGLGGAVLEVEVQREHTVAAAFFIARIVKRPGIAERVTVFLVAVPQRNRRHDRKAAHRVVMMQRRRHQHDQGVFARFVVAIRAAQRRNQQPVLLTIFAVEEKRQQRHVALARDLVLALKEQRQHGGVALLSGARVEHQRHKATDGALFVTAVVAQAQEQRQRIARQLTHVGQRRQKRRIRPSRLRVLVMKQQQRRDDRSRGLLALAGPEQRHDAKRLAGVVAAFVVRVKDQRPEPMRHPARLAVVLVGRKDPGVAGLLFVVLVVGKQREQHPGLLLRTPKAVVQRRYNAIADGPFLVKVQDRRDGPQHRLAAVLGADRLLRTLGVAVALDLRRFLFGFAGGVFVIGVFVVRHLPRSRSGKRRQLNRRLLRRRFRNRRFFLLGRLLGTSAGSGLGFRRSRISRAGRRGFHGSRTA